MIVSDQSKQRSEVTLDWSQEYYCDTQPPSIVSEEPVIWLAASLQQAVTELRGTPKCQHKRSFLRREENDGLSELVDRHKILGGLLLREQIDLGLIKAHLALLSPANSAMKLDAQTGNGNVTASESVAQPAASAPSQD